MIFLSLAVHARSNLILWWQKIKNNHFNRIFSRSYWRQRRRRWTKNFFFFTDSAHTCLCNDVSHSNTMEIWFFFLSLCAIIFYQHTHTSTPRRRLNRTRLFRNPIRLSTETVPTQRSGFEWNSKWRMAWRAANFMSNTSEPHTNCLSFQLLCFRSSRRRSLLFVHFRVDPAK